MRKLTSLLLSMLIIMNMSFGINAIGETITNASELQAALDKGGTVVLTDDLDISNEGIKVTKDVTLDLNGHTIKAKNSNTGNIIISDALFVLKDSTDVNNDGTGKGKIYTDTPYGQGVDAVVIAVCSGGRFTMESGLIDTASAFKDNANEGQFAVGLPDNTATENTRVMILGGHIKAGWYAIAGLGNATSVNHNIIVNGGILESTSDYAIYLPQPGTTEINGGTIYGMAGGIAIKRGKLVVNDGKITSKGQGSTGDWGDGTGKLGNAAINIDASYGDVDVKLNNGNFIAEGDAITIVKNSNNQSNLEITGGTFSSDVSKYLNHGYGLLNNTVVKDGQKLNVNEITPVVDENNFNEANKIEKDAIGISMEAYTKELSNEENEIVETIIPDGLKVDNIFAFGLRLYAIKKDNTKVAINNKLDLITEVKVALTEEIVNKLKNATSIKLIKFSNGDYTEYSLDPAYIDTNTISVVTDIFNDDVTYALLAYGNKEVTPPTVNPTKKGDKDLNSDGIISCEEEMNSKNWIWSNTKKACVYKVTNTKAK